MPSRERGLGFGLFVGWKERKKEVNKQITDRQACLL